jgi:predicted methyltransferase
LARPRDLLYRHFSPETHRLYVLYREGDDLANLEISGIKMKSSTPSIRAVLAASLRHLKPLVGVCLDTCAGLGYTAIAMASSPSVSRVVSYEVDANVIEVMRHNPDSARMFTDPKIELHNEDVFEALDGTPDATFDRVFHDPPRVALAGELYSAAFYAKLLRVMKPGARLFHYTGAPGEKAGKSSVQGIIRRLTETGFRQVRHDATAQGVSARR